MISIIIITVIILLFIILSFTKISIHLYFHHDQDNDQLTVKVSAWFGLLRYTFDVPLIKMDKESASIKVKEITKMSGPAEAKEKKKDFSPQEIFSRIHDVYELVKHVVGMHEIVRKFLTRVEVKKLEWHSNIGVGDAAYTGIITGAGWSIKGGIIGFLSNCTNFQARPELSITPYFQQAVSQTLLKCMIRFRIGYAILAGIRTVKYWKGGRPKFKTRPLSMLSKEEQKSM